MEFGSFMEFPGLPGMGQPEAFRESLAHVDMAEELGVEVG